MPFALFNYSSLSYVIIALSSAVTNPPNQTSIFHDFQGPTIKFLNSMTCTTPVDFLIIRYFRIVETGLSYLLQRPLG